MTNLLEILKQLSIKSEQTRLYAEQLIILLLENIHKNELSQLSSMIDADNNMYVYFITYSTCYSHIKIRFLNESDNTFWFGISLCKANNHHVILKDYDLSGIMIPTKEVINLIIMFAQFQLWSLSDNIIPMEIVANTLEIYTTITVLVSAVRTGKTNLYTVEKIMEYFKLPLSSNISQFSAKINKMLFKREIFCLI
jgi:hypothetical protein